jgi:oryzin
MVSLKALALLFGVVAAAPAMKAVPNKFIVTLKPSTDTTQLESHVNWARDVHARSLARRAKNTVMGGVDKVWTNSFKGYSGEFDASTLAEIKDSDDVRLVSPFLFLLPF